MRVDAQWRKALSIYFQVGTAVWGGGEDRVQAGGSPEEAEVGWLEQRGVSGDNKVVKEVLDVRKAWDQKTKLFFIPQHSSSSSNHTNQNTPRCFVNSAPTGRFVSESSCFIYFHRLRRTSFERRRGGIRFPFAGPRHSKLIRHSRKSQRCTDQRKVATRRQIRPVLSSVSPAGTPPFHPADSFIPFECGTV